MLKTFIPTKFVLIITAIYFFLTFSNILCVILNLEKYPHSDWKVQEWPCATLWLEYCALKQDVFLQAVTNMVLGSKIYEHKMEFYMQSN